MTFFHDLRRCGARVLAPVLAATALLAACGGGTQQVQSFVPSRLLVLGDENSVIADDGDGDPNTNDGFKYSLNDRVTTTTNGTGKCLLLPTFSQQIAAHYGFVFAACNPEGALPKAFVHAEVGAQAGSSTNGLQAQASNIIGGLGATDMVMVMIGTNDMIAVYEQVRDGVLTEAQGLDKVEAAGRTAATDINAILATGARALVLTAPDLSVSPYAAAQELVRPGAKQLLSLLASGRAGVGGFNGTLRMNITPQDGRVWGLVVVDDTVLQMARTPTSFLASPASVTEAVCDSASMPQGCLIVTGATAPAVNIASNTHLWASDRHLGPVAHAQIGAQALSRAVNNPF